MKEYMSWYATLELQKAKAIRLAFLHAGLTNSPNPNQPFDELPKDRQDRYRDLAAHYLRIFHNVRRAHDSECESEFDSQAYANTPCGCAARRAAEVAPKPAPAKRADAGPFGKWEIEPALSCEFDLTYTNDDDEAFDIATRVLERLWDDMEPGDTRTLRITLNAEVPRG